MITTHLQKASGIIQTGIGKVDQAARSQVEQGDEQETIQKLQHAAGVAVNAGFSATALAEGTIRKSLHKEKEGSAPTEPTDKVKEITERLEQGIKDLFQSDRYKEYLRVMSRFHNYSFNNSLLISMQKPDATYVAGYTTWDRQFGRHVMKGEIGIRILAPAPYRAKREVEKVDPVTHKPIIGRNGQPITEHVEVVVPAYKVATVFDVSQTEGRELPQIAIDLQDPVKGFDKLMDSLRKASPVPIEFAPMSGLSHGYYHLQDKKIVIREGMSEQQTIKTCIHEMAHAILHDKDTGKERNLDSRTREVQAESVAYTVCQHFGIDSSSYSFGYITGWSRDKNMDELKESMNTIRSTSSEIISYIEKNLSLTQAQTLDSNKSAVKATSQTKMAMEESAAAIVKPKIRHRHH